MTVAMDKVRVLMTGATGFVGARVARAFVNAGYHVHALTRPTSNLAPLSAISGRMDMHTVPTDTHEFGALLTRIRPDVVIHLASMFTPAHTPAQVQPLIESNVMFPTQLLEAMASAGVKRFINTSSHWTHYRGDDYVPANLYAATKQAYQDILEYYIDAHGMRAVTLELFDTYGPDDPRPKVLNLLKRIARSGESLDMSPGMQRMDFVHVDDVAHAYRLACQGLLAEQWDRHAEFSVRTGQAKSLRELVGLIEAATGYRLDIAWGGRPYREREVMAPHERFPVLPGWQPSMTLESFVAGWSEEARDPLQAPQTMHGRSQTGPTPRTRSPQ